MKIVTSQVKCSLMEMFLSENIVCNAVQCFPMFDTCMYQKIYFNFGPSGSLFECTRKIERQKEKERYRESQNTSKSCYNTTKRLDTSKMTNKQKQNENKQKKELNLEENNGRRSEGKAKGKRTETREECIEEKETLKWQVTNWTTETLENF